MSATKAADVGAPAQRELPRASRQPSSGRALLSLATLVVLAVAIFSYPQLRLLETGEPNVSTHLNFAVQIGQTGVLYPGHFLYHGLVVVAHALLPVSWLQAHLVIAIGVQAALAVLLWILVRRTLGIQLADRLPWVPVVGALSLMLASAVTFFTWRYGNHYLGYLVPNVYISHTYTLLQPLALLTFLAAVRLIRPDRETPLARGALVLGILAVLSALAKPSYVMVLIPALFLLLLLKYGLRDIRRFATITAFLVVPVLAVIAWQYLSTYTVIQGVDATGDTGIRLAPFLVMGQHSMGAIPGSSALWLLPKLLLSLLFPLAVAGTFFQQARKDLRLQLAWLQLPVGMFFAYVVAEYPVAGGGNFVWSGHIALFVLFVASLLFLLERAVDGWRSDRSALQFRRLALCGGVFVLHVVSGLSMVVYPSISMPV